jgi:CelD/BcsL family acetyltransferase involved in cellulose biosynthesis
MAVQLFPFNLGRRREAINDWRGDETATAPEFGGLLRSVPIRHPMRIEIGPLDDHSTLRAGWTDLIGRGIESNGFLEPAFAMAAAQHFLPGERPMLMRLECLDEPGRLLGLFAWEFRRGSFGTFARIWCPPLVALGTPLIDSLRSAEVLDAVRAWFRREHPEVVGLHFAAVPTQGPFVALLQESATVHNLALRQFAPHKRAVLNGGAMQLVFAQGGRGKEMRRQRRRLAELGELTYRSASTRAEVREALEYFLAMEAAGWKGRAGTALLSEPSTATFVRTMTRELASEGNCRIDSLELDGKPIAMGIVLSSRDQSWLWKIAYDEKHANLSPGTQFVGDFTRRQLADPSIRQTDSCAIPDHPMIDRLWTERLGITDIAISISSSKEAAFHRACDAEERRRSLRATLKRLYLITTGRAR